MKRYDTKVSILPNYFLKEDGTYNKDEAIKLSGQIAGICYDKEGYDHLKNEPEEKTMKRVDMTINNGHHSVYDHLEINFYFENVPKILAMVLNNEKEYTTSEKSARYTPVERTEGSIITKEEETLYNKWKDIFKFKIGKKYSNIFNEKKIDKLAQENARYLVTVFMPTKMVYTTSLRQINYIASWMEEYIKNVDANNIFQSKLAEAMYEFIEELHRVNVLDERLMHNEKHRELSLFGKDLDQKEVHFGNVYSTLYKGSFAQLAQAHRHRTLDYQMEMTEEKEYFVPPIIADNAEFVEMWLYDMNRVKDINPQGELVKIYECGKYEDFILKCKERLCSAAQLEIMMQTKATLTDYQEALIKNGNPLFKDIVNYTHGARCTFPDFDCTQKCGFAEGVQLTRKI
ncbi:MAG: FAD-dependent thymidylate synthase [Bacilli bacterium]|nr:FAD-dependent thymidylate synthase [Bacilli bacterium]